MEHIRGKQEIIDPTYRYKMEVLIFQKEKTKTCITNLDTIAKNIKIPNMNLIVTFLKKKLAIQIAVKKSRVIISNNVDTKTIKTALYEFIEYFVLCKICHLPELDYRLDNKKKLAAYCMSCGKTHGVEHNQYTEKVIKNMETQMKIKNKKEKKKKK